MAFTDKSIKALAVTGKTHRRYESGSDPGFGIQVSAGGTKTFFQQYRINGKTRFMRLGSYPDTSLADARKAAREARKLIDQDIDPKEYYEQLRLEEERAKRAAERRGSVQDLFDAYLDRLKAKGKKSIPQIQRVLEKDALPVLGADTKAADVEPDDIKRCLFKVIDREAYTLSNRLRSYLRAAFQNGLRHDNDPRRLSGDVLFSLKSNPVDAVPRDPDAERSGERALSWEEIQTLWHKLGVPVTVKGRRDAKRMNWQCQRVLKLMLALGGQRAMEVLSIRRDGIDRENRIIELPDTKNGRWHIVPLHPLAESIIDEVLAYNGGDGVLLFPARGNPQATSHVSITTLDHELLEWCTAMATKKEIEPFTPRDLRRTCKTRMGELGISKEYRDRLHNHALTDVSSRHYDRYDYLAEKREAIDRWCDHLQGLLEQNAA